MPLSTVKRVVDIREAEGNVYISMFQMSWYIILPLLVVCLSELILFLYNYYFNLTGQLYLKLF